MNRTRMTGLAVTLFASATIAIGVAPRGAQAQARVAAKLSIDATVTDAVIIAGSSYAGGAAGFIAAIPFSESNCDRDPPPTAPFLYFMVFPCLVDLRGPFREGWYAGTSVGFSTAAFFRARARGCSVRATIPRILGGAALGALPAIVARNASDDRGAWRWQIVGAVPLLQGGATATLVRSCARAPIGRR